MSVQSERDPLLHSDLGSLSSTTIAKQRPGPLEISKSTRTGILAGIWVATFLFVRHPWLAPVPSCIHMSMI